MLIGPTFGDEIIAAGLGGLPFSWDDEGNLHGLDALTEEQNASLLAVLGSHDPNKTRIVNAISDRQFAMALKNAAVISFTEAMAFVQTGTVPAALRSVIDALPEEGMREDAALMLAGATTFERDHPMTAMLQQGMGWTDQQTNDLWRAAAAL